MLGLARCLAGPFAVLYVLLDPAGGRPPGRYESPYPLGRRKVEEFFERFEPFLESDGRHSVWIMTEHCAERVIYDRHQLVFAYGPIKEFERTLVRAGFTPSQLKVAFPHRHHVHAELDPEEERLLEWWPWVRSPLWPGDDL